MFEFQFVQSNQGKYYFDIVNKDYWVVLDVLMKVPEDPDVQYDQTGLKARKTLKDSAGPFT